MHIGDRVENKINGARGRVAAVPPKAAAGSISVLQDDDTTTVWSAGDAQIVKSIADMIAEQEKVVQAAMRAVQQTPTEDKLATMESASAQLRQFMREARGILRIA